MTQREPNRGAAWKAAVITIIALLIWGWVGGAGTGQAQKSPWQAEAAPGLTVWILEGETPNPRVVLPPQEFLERAPKTATIQVNYLGSGWTPEAQAAFQYAVNIWQTLLTSSVPIVVNAQFEPLGLGVLGGAGPTNFFKDLSRDYRCR